MKRIILIVLLSPTIILCKAQKIILHTNQQWLQYYNQLIVSEKLILNSDASLRRINSFNQWSQITLRTGLGYQLSENLHGISGIGCFVFYYNNLPGKIEFRPYQEINTSQKFSRCSVQHRIRAEARYFRKISEGVITSDSNFNFRFRYRLLCIIPLLKLSGNKPDNKILLNIGDEIFINAGKDITYNMLDNNRLLLGVVFSNQ